MKLFDIVGGAWAITPDKLAEIRNIYDIHMKGDKIDIPSVEDRMGGKLENEKQGYQIVDSVAVIPIHGVIGKKMNLFSQISGGASTELIRRDIEGALADERVESILLDIDSPGGTVDGTEALANFIFESRGDKKIVAFADGMMASAAYWIGSAADEIYAAGDTTNIGSIGVVATHMDVSGAEEKAGVKTTEITAGAYKRIYSEYETLSEEGRADIQDKVDYLYSVFVDGVAKFRGVSSDTVLSDMADGRLFIGKQALDAGLVDGVSTFEAVVGEMVGGSLSQNHEEGVVMEEDLTIESLTESNPDLVEAIRKEGAAIGAKAELERVQAVKDQSLSGHEVIVEHMMFDGKTSGPEAAVKILQAEREAKETALSDMEADAAIDVEASGSSLPVTEKDFDAIVKANVESGMTLGKATISAVESNPEAHALYLKGKEDK